MFVMHLHGSVVLTGSMGQLPTYILFENAIEVSRFPEFNFEAAPTPPITKVMIFCCQSIVQDAKILARFSNATTGNTL